MRVRAHPRAPRPAARIRAPHSPVAQRPAHQITVDPSRAVPILVGPILVEPRRVGPIRARLSPVDQPRRITKIRVDSAATRMIRARNRPNSAARPKRVRLGKVNKPLWRIVDKAINNGVPILNRIPLARPPDLARVVARNNKMRKAPSRAAPRNNRLSSHHGNPVKRLRPSSYRADVSRKTQGHRNSHSRLPSRVSHLRHSFNARARTMRAARPLRRPLISRIPTPNPVMIAWPQQRQA
jgi:hypothetical protein